MAMSVAENPVAARTPRSPQQQVALGSLLGALYLLGSLWIVFAGLPVLWTDVLKVPTQVNEFLSDALLIVVDLFVVFGLAFLGYQLLRAQTRKGLRAGILCAAIEIFVVLWIGVRLGALLQQQDLGVGLGAGVTIIAMIVLLIGAAALFLTPGWYRFLEGFEDQGWFTFVPYKGNQGVRMRRATVLGALVVGFFGIVTMVSHHSFGSERLGPNNWAWTIPFTSHSVGMDRIIDKLANSETLTDSDRHTLQELIGTSSPTEAQIQQLTSAQAGHIYIYARSVPLMFKLHLALPVVMGLLLFYLAYRLVNVPTFADFLIATEAEMNKVSWTTRRRLVQDTIVVLVTVFLMTVFLFVIDVLWIKILGGVGVLQVDVKAQMQKQQEKSQW
jgi:preprotein translocase SecE subunit